MIFIASHSPNLGLIIVVTIVYVTRHVSTGYSCRVSLDFVDQGQVMVKPGWCFLFCQVKLPLREDSVFRQHHPPPPSSSRSYDSPSSSSQASSNNDPPPPISRSAASFPRLPTPPPLNFNSSGKLWPPGAPPPPPAPSVAAAAGRSPGPASREQEEAAVEDPSMRSFLGKIKAFEKMDHFARARRILEMQQAQNAKVEPAQH